MIQSQYILDILEIAFDDHPSANLLQKQVPFLTIAKIDHTGIGAFIHFNPGNQIEQYKLATSTSTNFDIESCTTEMISGIEIRNPKMGILADATVHLKNGIIDHLEIFNKSGEVYVEIEPKNYELHQTWLSENKRRTIIR